MMKRAPDNVRYLGDSENIYSLGVLPPVTLRRGLRKAARIGVKLNAEGLGISAKAELDAGLENLTADRN